MSRAVGGDVELFCRGRLERGALVRRGVRRGTYYVLAEATGTEDTSQPKPGAKSETSPRRVDEELQAAWIEDVDDFFDDKEDRHLPLLR